MSSGWRSVAVVGTGLCFALGAMGWLWSKPSHRPPAVVAPGGSEEFATFPHRVPKTIVAFPVSHSPDTAVFVKALENCRPSLRIP